MEIDTLKKAITEILDRKPPSSEATLIFKDRLRTLRTGGRDQLTPSVL